MIDIRQSKNYAKYMESLGWIVENGVFIKKIWFTAIVKAQRFEKINLEFLKKYRPFLIKLEPLKEINLLGFKKDGWPLLPTKTLVLDLNKIDLPKDTKYEIRKAEKNNLKGFESANIELFYKMLQETMKIGKWSVPIHKEVTSLYKAFQPNNSVILLCHPELVSGSPNLFGNSHSREMLRQAQHDTPIAGCLLIWDSDTAHYMYAALTKRGRELGAAYLTLWEAIKFCQKKGLRYLDLEGIYDERYKSSTKNWQGFTKFKMGWGGGVAEYPGSFIKYFL